MKGMLVNRGFSVDAAESISTTIIIQAVRDRYNPMTILDSMKKLNENDLSQIIAEVLNYNRFKTSVLGSVQNITPVDSVKRNILA
jgi:pantothenate kinase